jgi:AcrR family transcriptional regulator
MVEQAAPVTQRTPQTRDPEQARAAIFAAAVAEFTEHGFNGARMDAIATRSGLNKRMLYHYFGGKDALYLHVLEHAYAGIRSAEATLDLEALEPVEAIRQLTLFTFTYFIAHPEFLSLLGTENLHQAKFLKRSERIVSLNTPLIDHLATILARGAEAGHFRTDADALDVYLSIAGQCAFYLSNRWTLSTVFGRDLARREALEHWGEHVVAVVLGFLQQR